MPPKKNLTLSGSISRASGLSNPRDDPGNDPVDAELITEGTTGDTTGDRTFSPVVEHMLYLCDFPYDSTMVKFIRQQQWMKLEHLTTIGIDEIKDFFTVKDDGMTYEAKPLMIHLRFFKCFLLYHKRKSREMSSTLDEDDVLEITRTEFYEYCNSDAFTEDMKAFGVAPKVAPGPSANSNSGLVDAMGAMTVQEFRRGVKRDKTHYEDLKDDKYFNSWNRGFVATARMHHTHNILDEGYVPKNDMDKAIFKEIQTFMYAVLEDHLKTDKGKSLVSQYEEHHDAQSIYRELKKHALCSTAAQLSGDTLLQYITTTRYPGTWRGTSYAFVLHWKEQIMKYEKLELEPFPPKQKLRMLQNAIGDVTELAYVKQIGDQDIARGNPPLTYESYMALLLSACSTYDKKIMLPGKQKRAVYSSILSEDNPNDTYDDVTDHRLEVFHVDTDISDIMVNNTNTKYHGAPPTAKFLPREEWDKLSQEQKDKIVAQRHQERLKQQDGKVYQPARQGNIHEVNDVVNIDDIIDYTVMKHDVNVANTETSSPDVSTENDLLAFMAGRESSAGGLLQVLASKRSQEKSKPRKAHETNSVPGAIDVDGKTYYLNKGESITQNGNIYSAHVSVVTFRIGQHDVMMMKNALVDRGANGGICGDDMTVLEGSERFVDVIGLAGHKVNQLRLVTAQALVTTHKGEAIATFHQMALLGKGKSILSCIQMESFGADINDRSRLLPGGKQRILIDGYQLPLDIQNGLPYLQCRKPTEMELASLPHIIMTSDNDWDPSIYDNDITDLEAFHDVTVEDPIHEHFNQYGEYRHRTVATHNIIEEDEFFDANDYMDYDDQVDDVIDTLQPEIVADIYNVSVTEVSSREPNYEVLRPLFGWAPTATIKRTFAVTTRFARGRVSDTLKQHWRSRFPACNVKRRNEPVATDTVFSDTPAVDSGVTAAQIFVGRKSLVADVYGLKTDKEFVNTLEDNIRERGAMDKLISDCSKAEMSSRVKQILRALFISSWYSEPYHQNQNFAENRYNTIKGTTNRVLNLSGAPANAWLLAMTYVCLLLNHLASAALKWKTPEEVLTGQTPDISKFLYFSFYEPVYFTSYSTGFPSESNEEEGWWVGIATHVGDALTYKILTKTKKVIYRSAIRSALTPAKRNLRISPLGGEQPSNHLGDKIFIFSRTDTDRVKANELDEDPSIERRMVTIDPEDLIGRTFLKDSDEDGQRFQARVVRAVINNENKMKKGLEHVKFICEVPNSVVDEIYTYNDIVDFIERNKNEIENDTEQLFRFRSIIAHQGPLRSSDKGYKGSTFNVLVEWETGETTYEPLDLIAKDDPVTCAEYAKKHSLLDTHGWKRFRSIAKNDTRIQRIINQAKQHSYQQDPFWKFGFLVPRNHSQAMELDRKNGNTKWQDAEATEMSQLLEYQTFIDKGDGSVHPSGYKRIRCHWIYDVKHDGRHKARLVAGGHMTEPNTESVYSGVVSLRGIRSIVFLAELNKLELWGADVGNAYLEAKTKEKVYIIGGPEFGPLSGHTLIIHKALYGLRSSGLCWHERFADVLHMIGFNPSKAEGDIWMRDNDNLYEYIAVYVDDLLIAARNPEEITSMLENTHHFKLKGVGKLTYHLGCDYFRDNDGTMCFGPRKYVAKLMEQFENMYGCKPREYTSPLEKGDHPEIDTSDELDNEGIKKYQTMIGCLQWAVSLGRFDIQTATMTMSRFRVAPRKGHLERLKRMYGYLKKFASAAIRVRVLEPDFSDLPNQDFDWCQTVYGNVEELLPTNAPKPLGNPVTTITYVDANLYHDIITGRSVTGILHLCNQTLVDWYSKRQATVETATFGSEFTAARIAVDQIIDLRTTLRYLGVPVQKKSFMFGDNQAVVQNSSIPHSSLNKRHNALAYHRVREMIAAKILGYYWIDGKSNPADIVSKHWSYPQVWHLLKPVLFYSGDTSILLKSDIDPTKCNKSENK